MQWLYVLRGTLVAYGFAILLVAIATLIEGGQAPGAIAVVAFFGLFALIPMQVLVLFIWGLLARSAAVVTLWQTAGICAAAFFGLTLLSAIAGGDFLAGLVLTISSHLVGAIFGAVFWVGAFGFRRQMVMGKRMPEDC